eukprot:6006094-Pyramimonas_sp.AAC.1
MDPCSFLGFLKIPRDAFHGFSRVLRNLCESLRIVQEPIKIRRNPWNPSDSSGIHRNPQESSGIFRNPQQSLHRAQGPVFACLNVTY